MLVIFLKVLQKTPPALGPQGQPLKLTFGWNPKIILHLQR